jgi:hypothetical protein
MKHKILDENVLVQVDGFIVTASVVLSTAPGGKTVNYVDESGKIIKSVAFSRSPYYSKDLETGDKY